MLEFRSTMTTATARRLGVLAAMLVLVAVACSDGDDGGAATAAPADTAATEAPAAEMTDAPAAEMTEAPTAEPADAGSIDTGALDADGDGVITPEEANDFASSLDFGSGTGSITLGDETFELAIGPGTGLCRDVFDIIQAGGEYVGDRDIRGDLMIPPLDWASYSDGRYDPPSVELEITSTGPDNASWIADADWAESNDKVGSSQVDSYEKDGMTASGTATFSNAWDSEAEPMQGSFQISCAEDA